MKVIAKYSLGLGDRFAQQGVAQLQALVEAKKWGVELAPTWNKSNREHNLIHSEPQSVRLEAEAAVKTLGWTGPFYVDADHINGQTVDRFIEASDFFTIDVAEYIGGKTTEAELAAFLASQAQYVGEVTIPGLDSPLQVTPADLEEAAEKFLGAMQEAGRIYRHIEARKGPDFITEVSVDEADQPQRPVILLLILSMLAQGKVPVQTIAPKFTGRFNKGVDYVGDLQQFAREFEENLCILRYAIEEFCLPRTLKLSVHSGSDKFSLYPIINRLLKKHQAGVHVKTAGTTWLEELIGLAESDGEGLAMVREIYLEALPRHDELVGPYRTVLEIKPQNLPSETEIQGWGASQVVQALRHDRGCPCYNPDFRQFLHVSFKIAAAMGSRYTDALKKYEKQISRHVTDNLLYRHIQPLFT